MSEYAPIALFAYKRPEHTRRTLESLMANAEFKDSPFYVFCDGPRNESDISLVQRTKQVIREFGFSNVVITERERNLGLSRSIITGVSELCDQFGRAIVAEDDLVFSPYFLKYMNEALTLYENEPKVMQISGHMFQVNFSGSANECFFLPYTTTLGWATWKRAWNSLDESMKGYERLKKDRSLRYRFNMNGAYPYYKMIDDHKSGRVNSWGIQWYLSVFMNGGLTLHPRGSLVMHKGFDFEATHAMIDDNVYANNVSAVPISSFPRLLDVDAAILDEYVAFFNQDRYRRFLKKIINKIGHVF
ncbi:MAG: hypothetical protein M0Z61_12270 [Nitrospiraceae bacterium]|nr:hypothetical protein [Nitrospiraceae bacterium]